VNGCKFEEMKEALAKYKKIGIIEFVDEFLAFIAIHRNTYFFGILSRIVAGKMLSKHLKN